MIEDEIKREIEADKLRAMEEPYLFSDEEMDAMITWHPVSNIDNEEDKGFPKNAPQEVKDHHQMYINFWKITEGRG